MQKVTINKLNVGSVGRVVGIYQAIVGLVIGIFVSITSTAHTLSGSDQILRDFGISAAAAAFAIIIFPIVGFVIGWIQGVILAFVLNIVFAESGGLVIETKQENLK